MTGARRVVSDVTVPCGATKRGDVGFRAVQRTIFEDERKYFSKKIAVEFILLIYGGFLGL